MHLFTTYHALTAGTNVAEAEVALYLRVSVLCITESSSYDAGQSGPIWRYARRSRAGAAQFIDSQRISQGANKEVCVVTLRGLTPFFQSQCTITRGALCIDSLQFGGDRALCRPF
jgi:hypothetical protein